jgi:hypothetical protein
VAKVNASFEQLTHGELRKSHVFIPFPVLTLSEGIDTELRQPVDVLGFLPNRPAPARGFSECALARVYGVCKGQDASGGSILTKARLGVRETPAR